MEIALRFKGSNIPDIKCSTSVLTANLPTKKNKLLIILLADDVVRVSNLCRYIVFVLNQCLPLRNHSHQFCCCCCFSNCTTHNYLTSDKLASREKRQ